MCYYLNILVSHYLSRIFICYCVDISVTQFWVLYSLCYCLLLSHKLCVTVILLVTNFTICYMIVLPKLCSVVVVLQNFTMVAQYIKQHMNIVRSKNPGQSDSWITHEHMATFGGWLQTHLMNNTTVGDQLYLLARSPSSTILTFQG
jgi:hypothetical protein